MDISDCKDMDEILTKLVFKLRLKPGDILLFKGNITDIMSEKIGMLLDKLNKVVNGEIFAITVQEYEDVKKISVEEMNGYGWYRKE